MVINQIVCRIYSHSDFSEYVYFIFTNTNASEIKKYSYFIYSNRQHNALLLREKKKKNLKEQVEILCSFR